MLHFVHYVLRIESRDLTVELPNRLEQLGAFLLERRKASLPAGYFGTQLRDGHFRELSCHVGLSFGHAS